MNSLTVPGTLDSLGDIASFVKEAATNAGLDKKATYNLRLAVDEIATNIVMYGYEPQGIEGEILCFVDMNEQSLTVALEDTAPVFDPFQKLKQEEEQTQLPLNERPIGGLGVYLVVQGVDKFSYERVGKRNRNIFVMNRGTT
jgi:serine/threonine-protein kinase RsbW